MEQSMTRRELFSNIKNKIRQSYQDASPTPTVFVPMEDTNIPQGSADFNAVSSGAIAGGLVGGVIGAIMPLEGLDMSNLRESNIPEGDHDEFQSSAGFEVIIEEVNRTKRSRLESIVRGIAVGVLGGSVAGMAFSRK